MTGSHLHFWCLVLIAAIPGGLLLSVNSLHKDDQKSPDQMPTSKLLEEYQAEVLDQQEKINLLRNEQKMLHQVVQQCQADIRQFSEVCQCTHELHEQNNTKSPRHTYQEDVKKEREEGSVGFTVELSADHSLSDQVAITFDRIIIDSSDAFTPLLGTFTCPNSSWFAFYWSVHAPQGRVEASLVKHGEEQKYGALTCEVPGSFSGTSSMSAIAECTEGQQVWIKAIAWPDNVACNIIEGVYSSFTGFTLFSEDEDMEEQVGFTAELSANTSNTEGDPIIYNTVHVNLGSGYNPGNGLFVCPASGVYVFTVSGHTVSGDDTYMLLNKNSDEICRPAWVRNSGFGLHAVDSGTSTGTCILELEEGDVITVTSTRGDLSHLAQASSFTGYRLPDSEDPVAFTVRLTSDSNEYLDGQNMIFNDIITNVGNQYFPSLGVFGCPDSELYFLTWSVAIETGANDRAAEAKLMTAADGETEEVKHGPRTNERPGNNPGWTSSSTQAIAQCEPERVFFIRAVVSDSETMIYETYITTFSGFRLPNS